MCVMNWPGKIDNKGIPFVQMDGDQGCHPVCGTGCAQFFKQVKKCGKDLTEGFLYFFYRGLECMWYHHQGQVYYMP